MILIVDDDYSVTASLGLLLKQKGFASVADTTPESVAGTPPSRFAPIAPRAKCGRNVPR